MATTAMSDCVSEAVAGAWFRLVRRRTAGSRPLPAIAWKYRVIMLWNARIPANSDVQSNTLAAVPAHGPSTLWSGVRANSAGSSPSACVAAS
ncbi:hypothetical protein Atai01_05370 [Amycolatopsis taiwanensis]|uniref:Uncharacterized protein n=1 Tax=Amycolatopsis taiwanensis TaxID=342230 RepID=A0A9W6QUE0_9PSEU|nr:hypothetical protein Atai01_05370 [Amycolatopsis taiwanensis]